MRVQGIGKSRTELAALPQLLDRREREMIEAQTFAILRNPEALNGAAAVTRPRMTALFRRAGREAGFPWKKLRAIAWLESNGNPKAQSPTGPKGIMQIAKATAKDTRDMALKVGEKVTKVMRPGRNRRARKVTILTPDERLIPQKAVPAAARHLARLKAELGDESLAIWAYHCGEGCVEKARTLAEQNGLSRPTVTRIFFLTSPALRPELHQFLQQHMERDGSPTYWFRVIRAEQLLDLYLKNRASFAARWKQHQNPDDPAQRFSSRPALWVRTAYHSSPPRAARALPQLKRMAAQRPATLGIRWSEGNEGQVSGAAPSAAAVGMLLYLSYETKRLLSAVKPGADFVPLSLVSVKLAADDTEAWLDQSSEVVTISLDLPDEERNCLRFILNDLSYAGYMGTQVSGKLTRISPSPSHRSFFMSVYQQAVAFLPRRARP
jgi:hypothetical protein